ncbi:MAG: hypothetical protein Q9225_007884 [Loekoesia sp. 1 TL-2023]
MDQTRPPIYTQSPRSLSPTISESSVEIILNGHHSANTDSVFYPTSTISSHSTVDAPLFNHDQIRQERATRRYTKFRQRLEVRLGPVKLATHDRRRARYSELKAAGDRLIEEACMKRELKRAKSTRINPKDFQTIDIPIKSGETNPKAGAFIGEIIIQDHLTAMKQALSEHTRDGPRRKEPGRHSFHVDAAVSREDGMTGIAVVHKMHRQDWASPWTANGYRMHHVLSQNEAEVWAIWQALEVILDKVRTDRQDVKPRDPCSLAVIYTDSQSALHRIGTVLTDVEQRIVTQSTELTRLGVKVRLHWVPGHRRVPGNELADLVSNKARQPIK